MNRVGLKDYLLNYADDIDLLDCAKDSIHIRL